MKVENLIQNASKALKFNNIATHILDAELLLANIMNVPREYLLTNRDVIISQKNKYEFQKAIARRAKREPVAYITKKKEFWSLNFIVNNNVLIPRPETEIIVEQVVTRFKEKGSLNILDIGTGSGCILLSILKELKNSYGTGIDNSLKALNIAKKNSKKLNLLRRTKFIHCDIDNFNFGNYDVVVSNPPYICSDRINYLSKDIKNFEPNIALNGGNNGLDVTNKVIIKSRNLLKNKGYLFIEIGDKQLSVISKMLIKNGFKIEGKFFDYTKTTRCIMSTKII